MQNEFSWTITNSITITDGEWAHMIALVLRGDKPRDVIVDYLGGLDDAIYYSATVELVDELTAYLKEITEN